MDQKIRVCCKNSILLIRVIINYFIESRKGWKQIYFLCIFHPNLLLFTCFILLSSSSTQSIPPFSSTPPYSSYSFNPIHPTFSFVHNPSHFYPFNPIHPTLLLLTRFIPHCFLSPQCVLYLCSSLSLTKELSFCNNLKLINLKSMQP